MTSQKNYVIAKKQVIRMAAFLFIILSGYNLAVSQTATEKFSINKGEFKVLQEQPDPGWYFHSFFLGVELQNNLSSLYMSRVEESERNGDIWAIGGGETNSGDFVGLLFRNRNGNWETIDQFELATDNELVIKSLPLYVSSGGDVYYSDGYNLIVNRFLSQTDDVYTPENSGLPDPENEGDEFLVDIILDDVSRPWLLYSYPRIVKVTSYTDTEWDVFDYTNSPLPEPVDDIGIEIELPARHLSLTGDDLWISTHQENGGLIRITGDEWEHYTTENSDLPSNLISSVVTQSDNELWVSTLPTDSNPVNGGLLHIENDDWTIYTTNNGLPSNYVRAHAFEEDKYLWASFGADSDTEDFTHAGILAEFDGNDWSVIAEKEEFFNYLGWLIVDSNQNKWLAGDFNVIGGGVGSLNQAFLTFTETPDGASLLKIGTEIDLRWDAGVRVERVTLEYSVDGGNSWNLIASDVDANEFSYPFTLPDYHDMEMILKVSSDTHEEVFDETEAFTLIDPDQPYYHLRNLLSDGTYELYDPLVHGWQMDNSPETMWPEEKWENIEYSGPLARWPEEGVSSDFPSFDALVRAFGEDRTIKRHSFAGNIVPTLQARVWWMALKKQGYNGVCHGFSVTSLLAFSDGVSSMSNLGTSVGTINLYDAEVNNDIRKLMSTVWTRQWSRDHFPAQFFNALSSSALQYLVSLGGELTLNDLLAGDFGDLIEKEEVFRAPSKTLEDVKSMLNRVGPGVYYQPLIMFPEDDIMGGHSVLAYKAEQDEGDPDIWRIYIHDSNNPSDINTHVMVDTGNEYYEYAGTGFKGSTGLFLGDNTEGYKTTSRMIYKPDPHSEEDIRNQITGLEDIGYMFTLFSPDTDIRITDKLGNVTSLEGGSSSRNIPGSFPIVPMVGDLHDPIGYYLADLEYDVELDYLNGEEGNFTAFSKNKMYNYINHEPSGSDNDKLRYGNSLSVYGNNQVFDMEVMHQQDMGEKMFRLRDVSVVSGDSVSFNLENDKELVVNNYGSSTSLDLELRTDFGEDNYFLFENLELDESSGYKISVTDWVDIADQEVTLSIDSNLDGEYDDSKSLTSMPVSSSEESERMQDIPEGFELAQNYPNPFNPTTQISYSLPGQTHVQVTVYNTLGQEVATLVNETKNAGRYEVSFDASGLSSGVYIYRLQTDSYTETRQMMLIK